eukprot:768089-Hanusia_phi.AAC.5
MSEEAEGLSLLHLILPAVDPVLVVKKYWVEQNASSPPTCTATKQANTACLACNIKIAYYSPSRHCPNEGNYPV